MLNIFYSNALVAMIITRTQCDHSYQQKTVVCMTTLNRHDGLMLIDCSIKAADCQWCLNWYVNDVLAEGYQWWSGRRVTL